MRHQCRHGWLSGQSRFHSGSTKTTLPVITQKPLAHDSQRLLLITAKQVRPGIFPMHKMLWSLA